MSNNPKAKINVLSDFEFNKYFLEKTESLRAWGNHSVRATQMFLLLNKKGCRRIANDVISFPKVGTIKKVQ
jgi:hypothetical protein